MSVGTNTAFPWTSNGLKFRSRVELERVIEQFAQAGSREHLAAANTLMREAIAQNKLSADQYTDIKERLHL